MKSYLVRNFGKDIWQTSYGKIKESLEALRKFPFGGSVPEELGNLHLTHYRQVISGMNRIIYEIRRETVYVHIVCDTRKDMKSLLMRRLMKAV